MINAQRALETAHVGEGRSELDLARVALVERQVRVFGEWPVGKAVKRGCRPETIGSQCREKRHGPPHAMTGDKQALLVYVRLLAQVFGGGQHVIDLVVEEGERTGLPVLSAQHRD